MRAAIHPDEYRVASWLPEDRVGKWSVERFEIPPYPRATWREENVTPGGIYTKLIGPGQHVTGDCWMHDQPNEFESARTFLDAANGRVLITGLGIGLVPSWLIKSNWGVASITIIELFPEVIELVGPHLEKLANDNGVPLKVTQGDGGTPTGDQYDVAYHDYWPDRADIATAERVFDTWQPYVAHQFAWQFASLPLLERVR